MDTTRLGNTCDDEKAKTLQDKRLIVLQNANEELKRIKKLSELKNPQDNEEYRDVLSIDTEIVKTIWLSWGGGSDGFKLYFDSEKNLLRGFYFMSDWGEYEESELTEEESDTVYDFYMGGYFE